MMNNCIHVRTKQINVLIMQGLAILKAAFQTRAVQTSVFLGKKEKKVHILE